MKYIELDSELDLWLLKSNLELRAVVENKNGTVVKKYGFSSSFSVEEAYAELREEYPDKIIKMKYQLLT